MSSTDRVLDEPVECAACGDAHRLDDWIAGDGVCPACGEPHVVPVLDAARRAVERRDFAGRPFADVIAAFGLDVVAATDLLLALGADAAAALDVSRVVVDGRPRSEWRRWIGETREREAAHVEAVERLLADHGVSLDYPEE